MSTLDNRLVALAQAIRTKLSRKLTVVTPQQYGAVADGVTDDSAAFIAAIAYLKSIAINPNPTSVYSGSPKLFIPAGHYYLGTTALDINHTLIIEGEGSGWFGPEAGGVSRLRWAHGTSGIRFQAYMTSGNTTVDGAYHAASGGCELNRLCLEGGFAGTEGNYDAVVVRNAIRATDLYIKNWSGDGVKGWTGTVIGQGSFSGNISTTRLIGVKTENCRVGFDFRGTESNLIIFTGCEGYQNRQAGFVDENGSGGSLFSSCHATYNGLIGGSYPSTRSTYSAKRYAVKWGQETWCSTNAPSGTTAHNTGWLYVQAGGADAAHIAWTSGLTWRGGGDYVTLANCWNAVFDSCYSEGGGFSQFNDRTLVVGGTNLGLACYGGRRLISAYDGLSLLSDDALLFNLKSNGTVTLAAADYSDTIYGYLTWLAGQGLFMLAPSAQGHVFRVGTFGSYTTPFVIGSAAVASDVPIGLKAYAKASLPSAATAGQTIFVSDDVGGSTPAFADGTNWRRVADRAVIA